MLWHIDGILLVFGRLLAALEYNKLDRVVLWLKLDQAVLVLWCELPLGCRHSPNNWNTQSLLLSARNETN